MHFRLKIVAALLVVTMASPALAQGWRNEATITVTINQWMGPGREFNSKPNWHLGLLVAVAPNPDLPVYVGPVQMIVDNIPTDNYLIPSSIPHLRSNFSSPRFDAIAIGPPTGLELDGARYTVDNSMTIGRQPTNAYATGDVTPSVLTLRSGAYVDSPFLNIGYDSEGELHVYGNSGARNLHLTSFVDGRACMVIHPGATIDRFGNIQVGGGDVEIKNSGQVRIRPDIRISGSNLEWTNNAGSSVTIGGTLGVGGTLTNQSVIRFAGQSDSVVERFTVFGPVTLTGGGELIMVEEGDSLIDGDGPLINVDNVIRGVGSISSAITNQHIIRVEGGRLYFPTSHEIENEGGTILVAPGSTLRGGNFINGGILGTLPESRVESFRLRDVTVPGTLVVRQNSGLTLAGSLINTGTVAFDGDPDAGIETLDVLGTVSLLGGGELIMKEASDSRIGTGNPDEHLINVDNVIRGTGFWVAKLTNQHIIRVENGAMTMPGNGCDNTSGNIIVTPGSLLTGGFVEGGTVWTEPDSRVTARLRNVTIPGTLTVGAAGAIFEESIINTGTITFEGDASNQSERLLIYGTVTLTGGGEFVLKEDINSYVTHGGGENEILNADNVIRGAGYFQIDLTNQHLIRAENGTLTLGNAVDSTNGLVEVASTGTLATGQQDVRIATLNVEPGGIVNPAARIEIRTLNGDYVSESFGTYAPGLGAEASSISGDYMPLQASKLEIEIGGVNPGEFDQLAVSGDVNLIGSLIIAPLNGFAASPGQRFPVINVGGTLTGTFAGLSEGALVTNLGEDIFITYTGGDGNDIELYTNP